MEYQCVCARFLFYNGRDRYTVEYTYGLSTWYVFEDEKSTDALFSVEINPAKLKTPNRTEAENILNEFIESKLYKQ